MLNYYFIKNKNKNFNIQGIFNFSNVFCCCGESMFLVESIK